MSAGRAPTGVRGRRPAFLVLCAVGVLGAAGGTAAGSAIRAADGRNGAVTMPVRSSAEPQSISSAARADAHRYSRADSGRVARAQVGRTVAGPGEGSDPSKPARKRVSLASLGWAVLAVAVLAAAVATPLLLRRHRNRQDRP